MMSNETKRGVFEVAMNHATKSGWVDYSEMMSRYDDAFPDDMPVIPKEVGGLIKRLKSKPDSTLFDAVYVDHMVYEYEYKWRQAVDNANWIDAHADTFARAWLDGVWRLEETGEIVKLEEEGVN